MEIELEAPEAAGEQEGLPFVLSGVAARALGCLIEKEFATPDIYPLTLNALTNACNQRSNREPRPTLWRVLTSYGYRNSP